MFQNNTRIALLICSIVLACLLSFIPPSNAKSRKWGPWDRDSIYEIESNKSQPHQHKAHLINKVTTFSLNLLVILFQKLVSPVDGATCDFYPTCSAYTRQSFKKHGFFLGLAMASERISRDHTPEGYDLIFKFDRYYISDPVENNDFWFDKGNVKNKPQRPQRN